MRCRVCHDEGWLCESHRQPRGHDDCDDEAIEPCPDPTCEARGKPYDELFATTRRDDALDEDEDE